MSMLFFAEAFLDSMTFPASVSPGLRLGRKNFYSDMNRLMILLVRVEAISRSFRQGVRASSQYEHHFLIENIPRHDGSVKGVTEIPGLFSFPIPAARTEELARGMPQTRASGRQHWKRQALGRGTQARFTCQFRQHQRREQDR